MNLVVVVLGINSVSKTIGHQDAVYASLFLHDSWRELIEKAEPEKSDVAEIVSRIENYLDCSAQNEVSLPIAEAMVTYKERSSDEESSQVFVPFVSDVRVFSDGVNNPPLSFDMDEAAENKLNDSFNSGGNGTAATGTPSLISGGGASMTGPSGSLAGAGGGPCSASVASEKRLSPPSSPHFSKESRQSDFFSDPVDLQLDYWVSNAFAGSEAYIKPDNRKSISGGAGGSNSSGPDLKNSIKTSIRYMIVQRSLLHQSQSSDNSTFNMQYWVKEKKQKSINPHFSH